MILPSNYHIIPPTHPALNEVEALRIPMLKQMAESLTAHRNTPEAFALALEFTKMGALDFIELARRMGYDARSLHSRFYFDPSGAETTALQAEYVQTVIAMLESAPPYLPSGWTVGC